MYGAVAYNAYYMVKDAEENPETNSIKMKADQKPLAFLFNEFVQNNMPMLTKSNGSELYFLLLLVTSFTVLHG
ncbi:hypothetical protein OTK59_21420 [Vibrio natriegens]|jgi:hypothetical protein|uniref:hypothetical protein n=1 Tax=Vibrio TaxID=662 RepID=UPI00080403D2|nr:MULTISPECIES: hypothetical protein [Vibrio]ANQ26571.1 hypothetical protein BA894_08935 [Vibrio natriegens]AXT71075.1 hypothetical protein DBX26_08470 [Vibrio sp. dhg]MCY9879120.1 hypothetical protein [Vibrio natriegens]MEE3877729.1 hypothetical protein [Vibrio sp. YYF0003]